VLWHSPDLYSRLEVLVLNDEKNIEIKFRLTNSALKLFVLCGVLRGICHLSIQSCTKQGENIIPA